MNILVTGGCGFIGSNFIKWLLAETRSPVEKLVNLDALTYAGDISNLEEAASDCRHVFVHGGITDAPLVSRLLSAHSVDAVVNFAAESHVDRSIDAPGDFIQTNIVGAHCLLDAARRHWMTLPPARRRAFRFLHISSDEVYGTLAPGAPAFTEETPYAPNSPYAASKAAADHLARAYYHTYKLPVLTTNCSNNYGPCQYPEKLIPMIIFNALRGEKIPLYGDGRQIRDWLYAGDHATALWRVLRHGRPGATYNIGGNCEKTNLEMARLTCALLDKKSPRRDGAPYSGQITRAADRPGHDRRYAINCEKIQAELGWRPRVPLADGLDKTVTWYLSHPGWAARIPVPAYARAPDAPEA